MKTLEIITISTNTALKRNYCTWKPAMMPNPGNMKLASLEVTVVQNYTDPLTDSQVQDVNSTL